MKVGDRIKFSFGAEEKEGVRLCPPRKRKAKRKKVKREGNNRRRESLFRVWGSFSPFPFVAGRNGERDRFPDPPQSGFGLQHRLSEE
jgi:hypothetical protein